MFAIVSMRILPLPRSFAAANDNTKERVRWTLRPLPWADGDDEGFPTIAHVLRSGPTPTSVETDPTRPGRGQRPDTSGVVSADDARPGAAQAFDPIRTND